MAKIVLHKNRFLRLEVFLAKTVLRGKFWAHLQYWFKSYACIHCASFRYPLRTFFFKGLVERSHTSLVFLRYLLYNVHLYTHSFITIAEFRYSFFIAASSGRGSPLESAEPRFELRAALQQPDTLPTKPCRKIVDSYKSRWYFFGE